MLVFFLVISHYAQPQHVPLLVVELTGQVRHHYLAADLPAQAVGAQHAYIGVVVLEYTFKYSSAHQGDVFVVDDGCPYSFGGV